MPTLLTCTAAPPTLEKINYVRATSLYRSPLPCYASLKSAPSVHELVVHHLGRGSLT